MSGGVRSAGLTYQRNIEPLRYRNIPLIVGERYQARDVLHKPQLHHEIISVVNEGVPLPDVLASNFELRLRPILLVGMSDVDIDFVFRHRRARCDYSQRLRRASRVANVAFVSDGIPP